MLARARQSPRPSYTPLRNPMLRRSRIVPADGLRQSSEASEGTAIRCPRWALLLIPMVFLLPVLGVGLFLLPERREQQHDVSSPQSKASELTSVRALLGSASVAVPPAVRRVVAAVAQLPPPLRRSAWRTR